MKPLVDSWPVDVLADYARIVELLIEHGPNLKLRGVDRNGEVALLAAALGDVARAHGMTTTMTRPE